MRQTKEQQRAKEKAKRERARQMRALMNANNLTPPTPNPDPRGGRPLGLQTDATRRAKMIELVSAGVFPETAAGTAGISPSTWVDWQRRAKIDGEHPSYREFVDAVAGAEHVAESQLAIRVAIDDPKWVLERRFSKRYSKTEKVEMTGRDGGPMETNVTASPAETIRRRLDEMHERLSPATMAPRPPSLPS